MQAAQLLSVLCNLVIDACRSQARQDLVFKILNSSIHLVQYDRAILWDMETGKPRLMGVSGQPDNNRNTRLAGSLAKLVREIKNPLQAAVFGAEDFKTAGETWQEQAQATQGLSVMWLPITSRQRLVAGLWLERWGEQTWDDNEKKVLGPLADGYGAAWERFAGNPPWHVRLRRKRAHLAIGACLLLAAIYFGLLRTAPLRLVAPCEVVPRDPFVVTAPLDGVIEKVVVNPGERVRPGDLLFVYDSRIATQDLKIARQKVEVIKAQLDRSTAMGFHDKQAQAQVKVLKHRLEQQKLHLQLAEHIFSCLRIRAEVAGVAMIKHPYEWRGKPVRTGERVLTIIDPDKTKVRIWLAQDDNAGLDTTHAIDVFLHANPRQNNHALITYVSPDTSLSPEGIPAFLVEADWAAKPKNVRPGLKGSAVLYGPPTTRTYWLLRKPWSAARKALAW